MKKKVLFTATVDSHILHFHLPYLKLFKDKGYEVHVATNGDEKIPYCDVKHKISFERSPYKLNNLKAIKQLRKIVNEENFEIIHTHTPMGSVVTRLASIKARKKGTRVIYTAHGFHFYRGASKLNWLLFYPVEKVLSKYTDCLITINKEDYELAKNKFKKCKQIEYVPGVGIDEEKFNFKMTQKEKNDLRKSLGLKKDDFVLIQVGELNENKNQIMAIKAMREIVEKNKKIHLLLAGTGVLENYYKEKIKEYKLEENVHLLGYRKDVPKLLKVSDVLLSLSQREGLPVNVIEAMFCGLPVIATNCRGNRDLVKNNKNGYLIEINEINKLNKKILMLYKNIEKYNVFKEYNINIINKYMQKGIIKVFEKLYFVKKTVLHLLASNKYSGAENVVCTIIDNMKNEYEFLYCSPTGPIVDSLMDKNVKYVEIKSMNINNLNKILKIYKPNIVHCHDFKASILVSFSKCKSKIISHIHKNDPKMKKICIKSILYLISSIRYSKVVGVSDSIFNEFVFKKIISKKYITLENYVDKEYVLEKSNEFKVNKQYDLFFIGRLSQEKNPLMFIEIVKSVNEKRKIKAIMIGDGPLYKECSNLISKYKLDKVIEMIGFQKNPYPYIKASKIGIMPSLYEGFGLTAIESIILGKPVLNSGVGGLNNIFLNSKFLICSSVEEYVEKIILGKFDYVYIDCYINIKVWQKKLGLIYN